MAVSRINEAASFTLTFIANKQGPNVDLLDFFKSATRCYSGDDSRCSSLDSLITGYRALDAFKKGVMGLKALTVSENTRPWTDTAKDIASCLSGAKVLGKFGVAAIQPFSDILTVTSNCIGIVVQIKTDGPAVKTAYMVYFKILKISGPFFAMAASYESHVAVQGLKRASNVVFNKYVVLGVSVISLGHAVLSHKDYQLYNRLGLDQYFGQTAAA